MKPKTDPHLIALADRLELANRAAAGGHDAAASSPAEHAARRHRFAAVARSEPQGNAHASAYLGAGAAILGLLCLLLLTQLGL
jgi:hypothetical protein